MCARVSECCLRDARSTANREKQSGDPPRGISQNQTRGAQDFLRHRYFYMSEKRNHLRAFSRRNLLKGVGATSALSLAGCMSPHGHRSSYTSQIIKPGNHNTVFHWVDMALQCVRNQRVLTPRAAYDYGLTTARSQGCAMGGAGYLANSPFATSRSRALLSSHHHVSGKPGRYLPTTAGRDRRFQ